MMTMTKMKFTSPALAVVLALAGRAPAQFTGDVYFAQPSVPVQEGGVAELTVEAYVGDQPLGAVHLHVEFDPGSAEIAGFDGPTDAALQDNFGQAVIPGRFSAVVFNGASAERPIGTVRLGVLRVRPLVGAGRQVHLQIRVQSLLDARTEPFPNARGFAGVITVTSGGGGTARAGAPREVPFGDFTLGWQRLLLRIAPAGGEVVVHVPVVVRGVVIAMPVRAMLPRRMAGDRVDAK